jgi:bifunctional UDP-N-acetylglucosamine pyrophosphorylase/glucosamine-1-phosphate N-acetyltransferase
MPTATALVLAAGKGTRMKSDLPKVLHALAGRPMIHYPVRAALDAGAARVVVVVGHGRAEVERYLAATFGERVTIAVQEEQLGTGHAAKVGLAAVTDAPPDSPVLILYGDTPLVSAAHLRLLVDALDRSARCPLSMLVATPDDPSGYGRIVRVSGAIVGVREQKDCSPEERAIREINPGLYAARMAFLADALPRLRPNNAQKELYLTDIVTMAAAEGGVADRPVDARDVEGINDRAQLAALDRRMLRTIVHRHQVAGVTIRDSRSVEIHDAVAIEPDVTIERGVVLRGATTIARGATIDVGCVLTNVTVDAGATIKPYSVATDSTIGARTHVGPFTHLRPASVLGEESHVGNFVELKKTTLGKRSKANHLAYLGDGVVGDDVNVGAGTIFCNYDGINKHVTTLEDGAFIGSDSQLVAPVRVGKGAYVATGTTVTRDVPADALAIARPKQENKEGYASKLRARMKAAKKG